MRKLGFYFTCIVVFCGFLHNTVVVATAAENGINWYSYEDGLEMGKKSGKKIMLHFYSKECRYCTKMRTTTFSDLSVINYLNDNFISIRIDTKMEKKLTRDYFVRALPSSWFLTDSGKTINVQLGNGIKQSNLQGYFDKDTFLNLLKFIHTNSFKKMEYTRYIEN